METSREEGHWGEELQSQACSGLGSAGMVTSWEEGHRNEELQSEACSGWGHAGMGDFLQRGTMGVRRTPGLRLVRHGQSRDGPARKRDTGGEEVTYTS